MKPVISVIIPVYNHAAALERSLFSLHEQSCRPIIEVIVVDDGSIDEIKETIDRINQLQWGKDLSLKVFYESHRGASAARNRGMKEAIGEFVIFWDADTIGKPEMLQTMYETLTGNLQATYVYSQYKFGYKKIKSQPFSAVDLRQHNYIDTTSLIRREQAVPFDEALKRFQDWDVWLTLLEQGKSGVFIPQVLFQKLVRRRQGISTWLPAFLVKIPWKSKTAKEYEKARNIILVKHNLLAPVTKLTT